MCITRWAFFSASPYPGALGLRTCEHWDESQWCWVPLNQTETTPKTQLPPPTGWHRLKEEGRKAGCGGARHGAGLVAAHWPQCCRAGTGGLGHPGPHRQQDPVPRMDCTPPAVTHASLPSPTGLLPWKQTFKFLRLFFTGRLVHFPLAHQTRVVQSTPVPHRRRGPPSTGTEMAPKGWAAN